MSTYKINIAGLERELEMFQVSDTLDIAAFILFNDVQMNEHAAKKLLEVCPEHDVVLTAEAKSISLAYEMARIGCRQFVIARKSVKVYMRNPLEVKVKSITTKDEQMLYLGESEAKLLKGKRVLIVDDVISTGESLKAIESLAVAAGAEIVGKAAVLAEGDAAERNDIIFLEKLPLFFK